ncbi:hypothetical protein ACLOJK_037600, partial [Asimina triloba]
MANNIPDQAKTGGEEEIAAFCTDSSCIRSKTERRGEEEIHVAAEREDEEPVVIDAGEGGGDAIDAAIDDMGGGDAGRGRSGDWERERGGGDAGEEDRVTGEIGAGWERRTG